MAALSGVSIPATTIVRRISKSGGGILHNHPGGTTAPTVRGVVGERTRLIKAVLVRMPCSRRAKNNPSQCLLSQPFRALSVILQMGDVLRKMASLRLRLQPFHLGKMRLPTPHLLSWNSDPEHGNAAGLTLLQS